MDSLRIDALMERCAGCEARLADGDRITTGYKVHALRETMSQMELGLLGADIRTIWFHVDCTDRSLAKGHMQPALHHCIRCGNALAPADVVAPVYQVTNPKAVNPTDPTDSGVALGDRIYFVHADCKHPALRTSPLLVW